MQTPMAAHSSSHPPPPQSPPSGSAMTYSVTKAAGLHFMRYLTQTQGLKIRVNAVLLTLLLTDWGNRFRAERIEKMKEMAALKDYVGFFLSFSLSLFSFLSFSIRSFTEGK
ncbi:hypothetical protein B9Z19DRAFT_1081370 [Tuber borchii]|uniref:Uncharacterized protein n=1 Tax=Tuber borchii TaxID=42251 RepID=A0A2T6ZVY4_TUBBO|nr:hypothetical protein B9Z19DRAFT_1081370 [Tuber borchii]